MIETISIIAWLVVSLMILGAGTIGGELYND